MTTISKRCQNLLLGFACFPRSIRVLLSDKIVH